MSAPLGRVRTSSECSEGEVVGAMTIPNKGGVAYDMDGKFSYSQVGSFKLQPGLSLEYNAGYEDQADG